MKSLSELNKEIFRRQLEANNADGRREIEAKRAARLKGASQPAGDMLTTDAIQQMSPEARQRKLTELLSAMNGE